MQFSISDESAVEFARSFYEAIADGVPVDGAVAEARKALSLASTRSIEWGTPVLYMRSPDGRIFDIVPAKPSVLSRRTVGVGLTDQEEYQLQDLYHRVTENVSARRWAAALELIEQIQQRRPKYRDTET